MHAQKGAGTFLMTSSAPLHVAELIAIIRFYVKEDDIGAS